MAQKKLKIDPSSWIYGGIIGILLIVLEIVHYKTIIRDLTIEAFGVIIGVLFLILGAWLGKYYLVKRRLNEGYDADKLGLSNREIEVLRLVAEGYSNKEIADKLFVSLNTTKTHLSNIYSKLGVSRRTQAVQKARDIALISHREV